MAQVLFGCGMFLLFSLFGQSVAYGVTYSIMTERRRMVHRVIWRISFVVGVILVIAANLL